MTSLLIYPAPKHLGDLSNETTLRELVSKHPEDAHSAWMLANRLFSLARYQEAHSVFQSILDVDAKYAKVRVNLGVCSKLLGETENALSELSQALLLDPSLELALLHLSELALGKKDFPRAKQYLDKLLDLRSDFPAAHEMLGQALEGLGDQNGAISHYELALSGDSSRMFAQTRLSAFQFQVGKQAFLNHRFLEAFSVWAAASKKWPEAFLSDQQTLGEMKMLVTEFSSGKQLSQLITKNRAAIVKQITSPEFYYELFSLFFFSQNLIPELFVPRTGFVSELEHWQAMTTEFGEHPYAKYRIAVVHCYEGKLEQALQELNAVRDELPRAKHESLALENTLEFVRKLYRLQQRHTGVSSESGSVADWREAGFTDPFQTNAWSSVGISPADAALWLQAGVTPDIAALWQRERLPPHEALPWVRAGFSEPRTCKSWVRAKIPPEIARDWIRLFPESVDVAIQCVTLGFSSPEEAQNWLKPFRFPADAAAWRNLGFSLEEAETWIQDGFRDPFAAKREKELLEAYIRSESGEKEES